MFMPTLEEFMPDAPDAVSGGDLEVLRLSETPVLLTIFTTTVGDAYTHYVDLPNLRSELQCNIMLEGRCLLCDLKHKRARRAILPVFDVASAQVKALLISETREPHSLGPQLKAEVRKGGLDGRYLVLTRVSNKFRVQSVPAKAGQDMGELMVADFLKKLESGLVSLDRAIPVYLNGELWDVPELERKAEAIGLARSDYVREGKTLEAAKR
jgi:hypothetical protein